MLSEEEKDIVRNLCKKYRVDLGNCYKTAIDRIQNKIIGKEMFADDMLVLNVIVFRTSL